jgi:flagellar hook-length control protein FliK
VKDISSLAERGLAAEPAWTVSAHAPPGPKARPEAPDAPSFSEALDRAKKKQHGEAGLAELAALSAQAPFSRPAVEELDSQPAVSSGSETAVEGPVGDEPQPAGAPEGAPSPESEVVPEEPGPAGELQAAIEGQLTEALVEVTAATGQVATAQDPQVLPASLATAGVEGLPLAVQPEGAPSGALPDSAAGSPTSASGLVPSPQGKGGGGPQVPAPLPPDLPPSPVELAAAASGHLLETETTQEAKPNAPDLSGEPNNLHSTPQVGRYTDGGSAWMQALDNARQESGNTGSGQENPEKKPDNPAPSARESYTAAERAAQSNQPAEQRMVETRSAELARMAEARDPQFGSQISRAVLEMTRNGQSMLRLHLEPENLGRIALQVLHGPDGLRVRLSAELPATAALLESRLADLQQTLQVTGVNLAGLSISSGAPQEQAANWSRWQPRKLSSRSGTQGAEVGREGQAEPLRRVRSTSMVDYQI